MIGWVLALVRPMAGVATCALFAVSAAGAAEASKAPDTLASVCVADGGTADICTCASTEFKRVAAKDDVAIYADVGKVYLARLKAAKPKMEAWDDAIGSVAIKRRVLPADLADKASGLRVRYRDAIQQCAEATAALPQDGAPTSP